MITKFEVVEVKATKKFKNAEGKPRQITRTFTQTISPFNKNPDGTQKTGLQILTELRKERDVWLKEKP